MNTKNNIIQNLFQKYADHKISKEEYEQLLSYINKQERTEDLELMMDLDWEAIDNDFPFSEPRSEQLYQRIIVDSINKDVKPKLKLTQKRFKLWSYIGWTAAVVAAITMTVWLYNKDELIKVAHNDLTQVNDVVHGGNKATLTLADGQAIELSESRSGVVIGDSKITYDNGAAIGVLADGASDLARGQIQTITTPTGGTYQITLSDGTKVWLNAASSLTYSPGINKQKLRKVSLKGEGYFEVAKDSSRPFIVSCRDQEVRVLGTHFNISSYVEDKSIRTTLLEGSIQVNDILLKPNEQSILENDMMTVISVDAEKAMAWKNGKFVFTSEPIESIMKKLARWYNVEVIYKGDVGAEIFTGSISRYDNISKILEKISLTKAVHFKIEGRRVTIMP